jgi:hypothetical protein
MKRPYEIQPCVIDESDLYDQYYYPYPWQCVETSNCIYLVPEQIGGDETNRPTYCTIHGYDFPEEGCKYRTTIKEVLDETDYKRRKESQENHS